MLILPNQSALQKSPKRVFGPPGRLTGSWSFTHVRHNDRMGDLLRDAAARAIRYRREVGNRPVWQRAAAVEALGRLDEALPAARQPDAAVLAPRRDCIPRNGRVVRRTKPRVRHRQLLASNACGELARRGIRMPAASSNRRPRRGSKRPQRSGCGMILLATSSTTRASSGRP
jgi:hypothetical protein